MRGIFVAVSDCETEVAHGSDDKQRESVTGSINVIVLSKSLFRPALEVTSPECDVPVIKSHVGHPPQMRLRIGRPSLGAYLWLKFDFITRMGATNDRTYHANARLAFSTLPLCCEA